MINSRDSDRTRLFNRRVALLGGGQALLMSGLAARMYYLQVVESDKYRMLAEENRISIRLLPPLRGRILDRFGQPLAVNRQNFRVLIVPEQAQDLEATLGQLGTIISLSYSDYERVKREVRRKPAFVPVTVRGDLNWEEMARIQVNSPDLAGIVIDEGSTRHYPHDYSSAHVLGYVSAVDEDELTGDRILQLPGFRTGKAGVEKAYDLVLRGSGGTSQVEVNAVGRVIRELDHRDGEAGNDLILTLDERLQKFSADRIGAGSGSCVVLDIYTGEILVMASTPSFDPNAFNRGMTQREWQSLSSDPRAPMTNKAINGEYSPGSTFKMIVALAAMAHGDITPNQTIDCLGHTDLGDRRFHCWKEHGHGSIDMRQAIAQSCDVYFYEVARRVGVDLIAEMAGRFGFGSRFDFGLPTVRQGLLPTEAWKLSTLGEKWQRGETFNMGIGQGYLLATPLQLAVMAARIANGGMAVAPVLIRRIIDGDSVTQISLPELDTLNIPKSHLAVIRRGMLEVVNGQLGTARLSKLRSDGQLMSGKTGTTQVRRITTSEREAGLRAQKDLPWRERNHALFVGYAPEDQPRYAVSVVIEHGGSGATVAAPIARDIMEYVLNYDPSLKPRDDVDQSPGANGSQPV